ncbi:SDR family oxidoreductase [Aureimonas leprariae]|uniref:SDR family oxidoreductase n=1 Tax=Plantimonas leprariae TaxID=2615207 RepID=A0A7V7PRI7_9HYPH|nr:SDR family oxidoreductase [Aureimonas leprariae]KAB0681278.1 SDR family oxidoreductase [Aureimonas leprariae]
MPLKVALIVGGGSGMGAEAARKLREDGFEVGILSSSGKGEALGRELGGFGVTGTNRSDADISKLIDGALERWGRIDALVNSAGHGPRGALAGLSDADWHEGLDTYLLPMIRAARLVLPAMEAQKAGSIVNVSTYAAFEPDPAFPTSAVFRAGLASFAKLFADKHAEAGIRMNNVLPGFIDSFPANEERVHQIPMRRYGRVAEVAELIAFLASDKSSYITGQNIRIDGGITRSV